MPGRTVRSKLLVKEKCKQSTFVGAALCSKVFGYVGHFLAAEPCLSRVPTCRARPCNAATHLCLLWLDLSLRRIHSSGIASPKGADDALAALMSEAGMEEQATRVRRLKVQR